MSYRVITISREFGSGGRTIGREVADRLGYSFYDNELVAQIAKESGFAEEFVRESGEYASYTNSLLFSLSVSGMSSGGGLSTLDKLYIFQQNLIKDLAEKGSCVIVGRCADYILRDRKDCLHAFIYADIPIRAERIVRVYGETDEKPEKRVRDKDKKRQTYYRHYTDRQWGMAKYYDICLDSGKLGLDTCVDIITSLAK